MFLLVLKKPTESLIVVTPKAMALRVGLIRPYAAHITNA